MKALFWLAVGILSGAFGYRYWHLNAGRIPSLERLGPTS